MNDDSHPSHAARDVDPTVLDHIRPTVVVRRRIWEPPPELRRPAAYAEEPRSSERNGPVDAPAPAESTLAVASMDDADDEEAPPSSLFLAPESLAEYAAGASLEGFEPDDAPATEVTPEPSSLRLVAEPPAHACPTTRTVHVGEAIGVGSLADAMGRSTADLVAELVTLGFFEIHARTALPRKVASAAARAFGWAIEPPEPEAHDPEEPVENLRLVERRRPAEKAAAKTTRAARVPARAMPTAAAKRPTKPAKKPAAPAATRRRKTAGKHAKRAA